MMKKKIISIVFCMLLIAIVVPIVSSINNNKNTIILENGGTRSLATEGWNEIQKLLASDGAAGDFFGRSVSIGGDYALVGADFDESQRGSAYIFKKSGGNQPPNKPAKSSGQTNGKVNVEYNYTTNTTDPDGDQVFYWFDWGDGNNSGWVGPFDSGATGSAKYTWTVKGTYQIKVKAKDIFGAESDWSDPLSVTIPRAKTLQFLLMRLLERYQVLLLLVRDLMRFS